MTRACLSDLSSLSDSPHKRETTHTHKRDPSLARKASLHLLGESEESERSERTEWWCRVHLLSVVTVSLCSWPSQPPHFCTVRPAGSRPSSAFTFSAWSSSSSTLGGRPKVRENNFMWQEATRHYVATMP